MRAGEKPALFLDFDGTLAPIVPDPEDVIPDAESLAIVSRLALAMPVAIISGRALENLRYHAPIPGAWYAGEHGAELIMGETRYAVPIRDEVRAALREIKNVVATMARKTGAVFEDKPGGLAVHVRHLEPNEASLVIAQVERHAAFFVTQGLVRMGYGKEVVEVRAAIDATKGSAASYMRKHLPADILPIAIGDDATDEDMFGALSDGVTIKVGVPPTVARFTLRDTNEVRSFLAEIESFTLA